MDGNTIVGGTYPGADEEVDVFTMPSGGWTNMSQTNQLTAPGSVGPDYFGLAVGVSGTTVAVGAPGPSGQEGQAYVFQPGSATTTTTGTTPTGTVGAASAGRAAVVGDSLSAKLSCSGASGESCKLGLSLTSVEKVEAGKTFAVAARGKGKPKPKSTKRTVAIGSASLVLSGGGSRTVKFSLNSTGKALLGKFRKLPAHLTITETQASGTASVVSIQTVVFHKAKKKTKKKK